MRFDRIAVTNFKPYPDVDLSLDEGVTVVHGVNGSGKSSLLEACFFALYGARALEGTLEDVVTKGEDDCEVELWFTHEGDAYRVYRRVRATGERATTADCVLEGPDGTVDGARDVRARVAELLRMDHEAFLNCAYVRQGEVNKLINATPAERQDMIDELLQLGALEEYRERAAQARLGVNDVLADKRGALAELEAQVEAKEDADLHARLNELEGDLADLDERVEHYEAQREKAETSREEALEVLERYEETRAEIEELDATIDELAAEVRETAAEREAAVEERREARERVADLDDGLDEALAATELDRPEQSAVEGRLADLDDREAELREERSTAAQEETALTNQAENLRESATEARRRATEKRERAADLDDEIAELRQEIDRREAKLEELADERDAERARFEDAPVEVGGATDWRDELQAELTAVREAIGETEATLEGARERVEEAEALLEAGNCPECGQPVEGSPHVDALADRRERVEELTGTLETHRERRDELETRLEAARALVEAESRLDELASTRELVDERLADRREAVESTRERREELCEAAEELDADADERAEVAERKAAEAAEAADRVAELDEALESVAAARERVERVREVREERAGAEERVDRLDERVESLETLNDERRDRLAEKRERREELREGVDEERVEAARERRERAEAYIEQVDAELDRLAEERDDLTGRIGGVRQELDQLAELRDKRDALAERVAALESLHEESEALERLYGDLRAELRRQNVQNLERMLNETFDLVYGNDAYSHIELDGGYELTVYQKDGQPLDPAQLSGGERALFNLSLRCAIYRLLAAGIDGAAPMPPLILDEPTVFLDSGHVSRLVDLVEEMRGYGVSQILMVSHDDELVGAADVLVSVEKDPTSNRSTASREAAVEELPA